MNIESLPHDECDITIITDTDGFLTLKDAWNEILDDSEYPNPFLCWEWTFTWWKHFFQNNQQAKLHIFVLRQVDRIIGILPTYTFPAKSLHFLGYGARPCPEYLGPMIRKGHIDDFCSAITLHLMSHKDEWNTLFFESYALDDPGTVRLAGQLKSLFPCRSQEDEMRYYIFLPESYDRYLATLSSHNRGKKKNRLSQARRKYEPSFHLVRSVEELETWFPVFVDLTERSRKRLHQSSAYSDSKYRAFQKETMELLVEKEIAHIYFLLFAGEPVAVIYSLNYCGKCYDYQVGTSETHKGSPGDVLLQHLLMKMIDEKYLEFDFLRGGEWYKSSYTETGRQTEQLFVCSSKNFDFWKSITISRFYRPFRSGLKKLILTFFPFLKHRS